MKKKPFRCILSNMQNAQELEQCVDFILNRCGGKGLDVVSAAVERRKKNLTGTFSFDSEAAAKSMTEKINASIQSGMDGMTKSLRQFSVDLIAKEAPELSKEQVAALAEQWIPDMSFDGSVKPLAHDGKVSGIPADLLYDMALQFIDYGTGNMSSQKNSELQSSMGNWQEKYWKRFPTKVQQTIKIFFDGKTTVGECTKTLKRLLRNAD